jgi:hypothetical protein
MAINKDFAKKRLAAKKSATRSTSSRKARWMVVSALSLAVLSWMLYQSQWGGPALTAGITHLKTWMTARTPPTPKDKHRIEVVSAKNNSEPVVHFEFYTALPNMSMAKVEPQLQSKVSSADLERELTAQIQAKLTKREKNEDI